ncbi:MAG TPA: YgcG family protein [Rhodanobacteraceae bacterium]|nr:YgcG family protein [Rhodanobacteraceae bacterium]
MTTTFRWLAGVLALLFAASAIADDAPSVPALHARVTDETATLTAPERAAIESKLAALEQRKGAQIAVLIVATTQPETIEQYATRVFEAWKLGRKGVDDGVLLIVAKNDHRVRIEPGRGLEGAIPDAAAKRIAHDYLSARFAHGDFAGGLDAGIDALTALIDDEPLPAPPASARPSRANVVVMDDEPWWSPIQLIIGIMFGAFVAVMLLLLVMVRAIYNFVLGHFPKPSRAYAFGAIATVPIAILLRHPMGALGAFAAASSIGALASLASPPKMTRYRGGGNGDWSSSSSSSDGGSSSGGSSGGSDFSGGGGSSSGGGASDSW